MARGAAGGDAQRSPSTIGNWLHAILRALDARGIDGHAVARRAGVGERALANPEERIPQATMTVLWREAIAATGDVTFPLDVPRASTVTTFGALTYASLASPDLASAFRRVARFHRIVSSAVDIRFDVADDVGELTMDVVSPLGPPAAAIEAFFALLVRFARGLTAGRRVVEPLRVRMRHPAPPDTSLYRRVFRAPIEFGAAANAIVYARADCEMPLPDANLELALQNEGIVREMLDRLGTSTTSERLRTLLLEVLSESPNETAVARRMSMSRSSLHAALRAEGTTYRDVLNDTRAELARRHLEAGRYSIKEIAFLLGFADASTFSRAFKRWTGTTPQRFARDGSAAVG